MVFCGFHLNRNCFRLFFEGKTAKVSSLKYHGKLFFRSPEMGQCSGKYSNTSSMYRMDTASSLSHFPVQNHLVWTEDVAQ